MLIDNPSFFKVTRELDGSVTSVGQTQYSFGYNQSGAGDCSGFSASWRWSGNQLEVEGDRYGMVPLYYSQWGANFAISDSIDKLLDLGAPREIDALALGLFVRLGYHIGGKTSFKHIQALSPGGRIEWQEGSLKLESSKPDVGRFDGTRDEAIEIFLDLFSQAIDELRPEGRLVLPLSGGRDSRHILLELARQGRLPDQCVTVDPLPPLPGEDKRIAKSLASRVGVRHVALPRSSRWLKDENLKNQNTNYCADEHGWLVPVGRYLSTEADAIFDGFGGGNLAANRFQSPAFEQLVRERRTDELAEEFLSERNSVLSSAVQRLMISRDLNCKIEYIDLAHELAVELKLCMDLPNPLASFSVWNKARREIVLSPLRILSDGTDVSMPFLVPRLFDFLASCPFEFFHRRKFQEDAIGQGYPAYSDIPFEDTDVVEPVSQMHWRLQSTSLSWFLMKHLSSEVLNTKKVLPRVIHNAIKFKSDEPWLRPQMIVYLAQLGQRATV